MEVKKIVVINHSQLDMMLCINIFTPLAAKKMLIVQRRQDNKNNNNSSSSNKNNNKKWQLAYVLMLKRNMKG